MSTFRPRAILSFTIGSDFGECVSQALGLNDFSNAQRIFVASDPAGSEFASYVGHALSEIGVPTASAGKGDVFKRRTGDLLIAAVEIGPEWSAWSRPKLVTGTWFRYLGIVSQMQARLADPRLLQAAELTHRAAPGICLLSGTKFGLRYVVSTTDPIAAELAGLSLSRDPNAAEDELVGPWEDAIVQRATELQLGVRLPSDISVQLHWIGDQDAPELIAVTDWIREVAGRFGVADVTVSTP